MKKKKKGFIYRLGKRLFKRRDLRIEKKIRREVEVILSHELKTPLTSIYAYSELLMDNLRHADFAQKEETLAFAHVIQRKSRELMRFIDNVIHLSILELNPQSYYLACIDFSLLAQNTCVQFKKYFEFQAEDHFSFEIEPEINVTGNEKLLNDIVFEILANSYLYRKTGSPLEITLSLRKQSGLALLTITDNGIGIRDSFKDRVFDKFFRIEDENTARTSGIGIGLTLVKRSAEFFGGGIQIQSTFMVGTTVILSLPLTQKTPGGLQG